MFCENCNVEIPPAWKKVISSNVCPECGGSILSDNTKKIIDELKAALERMPNDPEGLAGWIMSTYDLTPKGEVKPTKFYGKPSKNYVEEEAPIKIRTNAAVEGFMERAGVNKIQTNPKMAALAKAINEINDEPAEDLEVDEESEDVRAEEEAQYLINKIKSNKKISMKEVMAQSTGDTYIDPTLPPLSEDQKEDVKSIIEAAYAMPVIPKLEADRMKRIQAQEDVAAGVHRKGMIKRAF